MQTPNEKSNKEQHKTGTHEHPLPQEIKRTDKATAEAAHEQAEHDMDEDPDFAVHSPNDDLDEGETARLGQEDNPVV